MSATIRLPLAAAAVFALAAAATAAPAPPVGANATLPYPAKAPLVVHVNGLERTKGRLSKMLEALPPAEAKQVGQAIEGGLKKLLTGRKLTAVPADGRAFLVIHDFASLAGDDPALSVLVPTTGYKEFKESFLTADERKSVEKAGTVESVKLPAEGEEHTVYMADLKGYVAFSPSKETAEQYAGKYTPAQAGAMGPELAAAFLAADVSLYVNLDVINDKYGEQIRAGKGLVDFFLGQAEMGGMLPGVNKQQVELMKTVLHGMFQAVEDSQGLVIAAEFRPEGLNLGGQMRFAEDSTSAGMLKPETPGPLAEVGKLPRGLTTYGGSRFGPKFAALGAKFAQQFGAADDDAKGAARLEKLLADVAAAGPQGEFTAGNAPDTALTVAHYKDAGKAAAALTEVYRALAGGGRFASVVLKEKPKLTEKDQNHRGLTFTRVQMTLDFEATVENLPEPAKEAALKQFKRLAKEKTSFWLGTDGKVVVTLVGKDWDAAKKLLDEYLDGKALVGADPGFQLTRKNLPAEATLLYLVETGQTLMTLVEQIKAAGAAIPGGLPPIGDVKPAKGEPTYVGVAVTLKARTAAFDVFVPGTAMNVGVKMLGSLFRNVE